MRKRKPHGEPERWLYRVLALGVVVLIGFTSFGVWQWVAERPTPGPIPYHAVTVAVTQVSIIYPTPLPPTPAPAIPAFAGSLVFSGMDGRLGVINESQEAFLPAVLLADQVTVSAYRGMIAYIYSGKLHLYSPSGADQLLQVAGEALSAAWSPDGEVLAFVMRSSDGDTLYRLSLINMQPMRQLTVPEIVAPPAWHPSTRRLLIAEPAGPDKTTLYTIDAGCESYGECTDSRQDFTTLPFRADWLNYQPSGIYLVAAERDHGKLYLITTAKKDTALLLNDGSFKERPIFSPDGQRLLYLDSAHQVYVVQLDTMSSQRVVTDNDPNFTASSVAWR